ncbi:MAG: E3 binding domain-containing protein [Alphaproteobacteria bacterium]
MAVDVIMPRVDMTMERGTIRAWKAQPGDAVREGALLFEIETDKSAMEIDAPASGTLGPILVPAGVEVPVGTVVSRILAVGEVAEAAPAGAAVPAPSSVSPAPPRVAAPVAPATPAPPAPRVAPPPAGADPRPRATPLARRLAREHGLDLASLRGTGPRGRIGRADVEAARAAAPATSAASPSAAPAAIFHSSIRADLGALLDLRARIAASRPGAPPPGPTTLLLRLLGALLPGHPALLGATGGGVHVAVALAREEGRRLAVLADLQGRRAEWIAAELARRAAPGAVDDAEAPRHALVLANVGRLGIEGHAAAPRRGEAPVLAFGAIGRDRHAAFTLAADRDALDPAEAMRFLARLRDFAAAPWLAL